MTLKLGAHVSIQGGVSTAPGRAVEIGATALGMFTKNQRQWSAPPLEPEEVAAFRENLEQSGIPAGEVLIHASYLINLGNPDADKRSRSTAALLDECRRAEELGLSLVNFHPGSGLGEIDEERTIELIAEACREVLDRTERAVLVLESTAGQGAHVGYRFEQLARIIERIDRPAGRVAVCVDTCHLFAAGYDVATASGWERTMAELASSVGLERLAGVHLNDSMTPLGSRTDRHESIGRGLIGLPALARIVSDPRLASVPFILETTRPELWAAEIALLRGLADGTVDPDAADPPALADEG